MQAGAAVCTTSMAFTLQHASDYEKSTLPEQVELQRNDPQHMAAFIVLAYIGPHVSRGGEVRAALPAGGVGA